MKDSTRKVLVIVGVALLVLFCGCGGLAFFVYYRMSSCVGEMNEPVETPVAELPCEGGGAVTVINRQTTTNWLEGIYDQRAYLRHSDADDVYVWVAAGRFRDWLPEDERPPHSIDGDASEAGFEVYLDPDEVPAATADAIEACLVGRADEVASALHTTRAHGYVPDPGVTEGVVYWRASAEDLEPVFTAPNGEMIGVGGGGGLWHQTSTTGTSIGEVVRKPDGSLEITVEVSRWTIDPTTTPISEFRTSDGETLEDFFGVAPVIIPARPIAEPAP